MKKIISLLSFIVLFTALNAQIASQSGSTSNIGVNLKSINTADYVLKGNNNISGTIKNNGSTVITSFDVTYKIDGGASSDVYSVSGVNILPSASFDFTHNVPAYFTAGQHKVETTISNVNGSNIINNENVLTKIVTVVTSTVTKRVFCEELTSVLCGYCVRGIVYMNQLATAHPTDWVGVSCHSTGMGTDPMVCGTWDNGNKLFPGFTGFPSVIVDRTTLGDPLNLATYYTTQKSVVAPVDVAIENVSYNTTNKLLTFTVKATSATTATVNWNINAGVYEMDVTYAQDAGTDSTEYQQHNYYASADGYGLGAMGGFENLADPVPASQMHYDYIARGILGGYSGTSGSIPTSVTDGTSYSKTYTYLVTFTQNVNNFHLVGFVVDQTSGKVLNSIQNYAFTGISETQYPSCKLYPNPTKGVITIDGLMNKSKITVTNIFGETVKYFENVHTLDLSNFANGVYFVKIDSDNHIVTKKIILNK